MSFDKAAIKRFNEASSCAPPPTKYDPKMGSSARDINFAGYSSRTDPKKVEFQDPVFAFRTPARPSRSRPFVVGSASSTARSASGSRLRKGVRSTSTKSLNVFPLQLATPDSQKGSKEGDTQSLSGSIDSLDSLGRDLTADRIGFLERTLQETEVDLSACRDAIEEKNMQYAEIESQLLALQKEKEENSQTIQSLRDELLQKKQEFEETSETLRARALELEKLVTEAAAELSTSKASLEELNNNHARVVDQLQQTEVSKEDGEQALQVLQEKLQEQQQQFEEASKVHEAKVFEMQQQLTDKTGELSALGSTIEENNKQHALVLAQIALLEQGKEEDTQTIQSLREDLIQKKQELETASETLHARTLELEKQLGETATELSTSEASLQEQIKNHAQVVSQLNQMGLEKEEGDRTIQLLREELQLQIQQFKEVSEDLRSKNTKMEHQLLDTTNELAALRVVSEENSKQHALLVAQLALFEQSKEDDSQTIQSLRDELMQKKQEFEETSESLRARALELEKKFKETEEELSSSKASLEEMNSNYTQIVAQLKQTEMSKEDGERALQVLREELQDQQQQFEEASKILEAKNLETEQQLIDTAGELSALRVSYEENNKQHALILSQLAFLEKNKEDDAENIKNLTCELQQQQKQHKESFSTLRNEKINLECALSEIEDWKLELELQYNQLQEQHDSISNQVALLKEERQRDTQSIQSLTEELLQKKHELEAASESHLSRSLELEQQLAETKAELTTSTANLQELNNSHSQVVSQLNRMELSKEDDERTIQFLREEMQEHQQQFEESSKALEAKNMETEQQLIDTAGELSALKVCLDELNKQHALVMTQLALLEKSKEDDAENIKNLTSQLQQQQKQFKESFNALQNEKINLESTLSEMGNNKLELELHYNQLQQQHDSISKQVVLLNEENEIYLQTIQSLREDLLQKKQEFEEASESHRARTLELEQQLAETTEELSTSKASLEELNNNHSQIVDQLKQMDLIKEDGERTIQLLREELQQQKQGFEEASKVHEAENIEIQQQLTLTAGELLALRVTIEEKDKKYALVMTQLTLLEKGKEEDAENIKNLTCQLQQQQQEFRESFSALRKEKDSLECSLSEMERKKIDMELQYNQLKQQHGSMLKQVVLLNEEKEGAAQDINNLKEELQQQKQGFDEVAKSLQAENLELKAQSNETTAELTACKVFIEEQQKQQTLADNQLKIFEKVQEDDKNTIKTLSEELDVYRKKELEEQQFLSDRESLEARIRDLTLQNQILNRNISEYERVYGDYANLVSHQNSKQKIHHVVKIKDENIKLRDENTLLQKKVAQLQEKLAKSNGDGGSSRRRFDPSQAFKPILREPVLRDERDFRGSDARGTFTVTRKPRPTPVVTLVDPSQTRESRQGMAFDLTFTESKENNDPQS